MSDYRIKRTNGVSNMDWLWSDYQSYLVSHEGEETMLFSDWIPDTYPEYVGMISSNEYFIILKKESAGN